MLRYEKISYHATFFLMDGFEFGLTKELALFIFQFLARAAQWSIKSG